MNVSRQIGWSQESNLLYQILKQLNKLTSIIFGLKPKYKVYTAQIYQTGGSNPLQITGGDLTIGISYTITENTPTAEGFDFTNVGARNNNLGTVFMATGTIPNSWGNGNVSLAFDDGAPTAIVLENTLGNVAFIYKGVGDYQINCDEIVGEKTVFFLGMNGKPSFNDMLLQAFIQWEYINTTAKLFVGDVSGTLHDDVIGDYPMSLEIRVYN
jgi:hypothetical protein